ncbi:MAG: homocysteine S-methyltransferase family protein [Actinomycetota bacterium]|nr:homocysteine S-methyltransferase family protein [Actinomycetota bacterium]
MFLTDGGIETSLIFHQGIDLPEFAAFDLLKDEAGREALRAYFKPYIAIARERGLGFILDTATWRASPDWAARLGYSSESLDEANRRAVELAAEIRAAEEDERTPIVIEAVVGPRGDGYKPTELMSAAEAERYHAEQIATFAETDADMVTGVTMTYAEEAIGIVRAARGAGMPVAVSFTVETDGRLPNGQPLGDAIEQVDAETDAAPVYYMINCAHPTHFAAVLEAGAPWLKRIGGIRANASTQSHAELDEAEELDDGDPAELASQYAGLQPQLGNVRVLGGCCGTDQRHVAAIGAAWPG